MILNPYFLLGLFLAAIAIGAGSYTAGEGHGVLKQKAVDQAAIDKVSTDLSTQKANAAAILKKSNDDLLATLAERDNVRLKLENEHVQNQDATTALRNKYAGFGLRFVAQGARCGGGSPNNLPQASGAPGNNGPSVVQLPDALARELRQSAAACDALKDDYKLLYEWAHSND